MTVILQHSMLYWSTFLYKGSSSCAWKYHVLSWKMLAKHNYYMSMKAQGQDVVYLLRFMYSSSTVTGKWPAEIAKHCHMHGSWRTVAFVSIPYLNENATLCATGRLLDTSTTWAWKSDVNPLCSCWDTWAHRQWRQQEALETMHRRCQITMVPIT